MKLCVAIDERNPFKFILRALYLQPSRVMCSKVLACVVVDNNTTNAKLCIMNFVVKILFYIIKGRTDGNFHFYNSEG